MPVRSQIANQHWLYKGRYVSKAAQNNSGLPLSFCHGIPEIGSQDRPVTDAIRRIMDVTLSLLALVALGPVLAVIAIAIKATSDGPVFFTQARVGQGGKLFSIFKFRTMYTDRCDASGIVQTMPDDSRVTPLGRVLRAKSIDELPQILNVIKGDMAIVGPRPHVREMLVDGEAYDVLVPYYDMRTSVRPGLSGWAQVNGYRGPTTDRRSAVARIEHDLAYIAHRSVWLDIRIIVLTIWYEVIKGNAN